MKLKIALKTMALNPEHDFPFAYCHQNGTDTVKLQRKAQTEKMQKKKAQNARKRSRSACSDVICSSSIHAQLAKEESKAHALNDFKCHCELQS